ncbi:MAG: DUF547 domain-containing protein [Proteobacteria bacterium]|nr:DUF547 domain-containing protein [Pseudomonadota bacterium]
MLEALFAPKARLWERWTRYDAASAVRVDHGVWQAFLARYLRAWPDGTARLAYGAVTAADRANLASYVDRLAAVPVGTLARPEQLAFWINLYNALTVKVVLDAYPVRSIRDIALSRGLFAEGPWDAPLVTVDGERVSLDDIEHRIVRPIWRDPRVHYALNCASIGCPNLPSAAFTRATSEALLEAAARAYINHPRGVDVDPRLGGLAVSKIYGWFAEDFGGTEGVIAHLLHYAEPALAARIRATPRLADYRYDWALNDAG